MNKIPEDSVLRRHYLTELQNKPVEKESYSNFILVVSILFVLLLGVIVL